MAHTQFSPPTINSGNLNNNVPDPSQPSLLHRLQANASVLTLLIAERKIYAGTQDGEIIAWCLESYQQIAKFRAHRGSVLCLYLSDDAKVLFSSGGDAIVNAWSISSLQRLFSIYSTYDVGDVFCVAYSAALHTVYLGAQNTSIQWYDLSTKDSKPPPDPASHPSHRNHRFFDSKDPAGKSAPRPQSVEGNRTFGGRELQIEQNHIVQFAHYGYVYCMLLAHELSTPKHYGEVLISGGGDGSIKLWALNPRKEGAIHELNTLENGDDSVLTMALCDSLLYSGKLEGTVDVWDLETCQLVRRLRAYSEDVLSLSAGHDLIFTGSSQGIAKIFNQQHSSVSEWKAHDNLILTSAVTEFESRELFVTGGNDGCIAIWNVSDCFDRPPKAGITDNEELVLDLAKLISFQTVSSIDCYARDCRRGASFLRSLFKRFGAETELLNTEEDRNPIVFARFRAGASPQPNRQTVLFYGHYDVVAADTSNHAWHSDPFVLRKEGGYLYGRGASDNKGPVLAALYATADVYKAGKLSADVVFLVEGEEESGSRGFQATIRKHRKLIGNVDWILLANSYWLTDEMPCLTYGLRGVVRARIRVRSQRPDLHSGVDGSRLLDEPMKDLVALLAKLTDGYGKIGIPGFFDRVRPITKAGIARYESVAKYLLRQDPTMGSLESLQDSFKAKWREPSLTLHRVQQTGSTSSSIIPHCAHGDISIRLVPNQTTKWVTDALKAHLTNCFEALNSSNMMDIVIEHCAEPWLGDPTNHVFQVLEAAVTQVWATVLQKQPSPQSSSKNEKNGPHDSRSQPNPQLKGPKSPPLTSTILSATTSPIAPLDADSIRPDLSRAKNGRNIKPAHQKPLYIREGGSIPAIRFLEQEFDAPAAHLPCGQASDSAHLDNERLRIINLYNCRRIFQNVFINLGKENPRA